jgi:hypothetical protein
VVVATDIRPYPAALALALLVTLYGALPLYELLLASGHTFPRLGRAQPSPLTLKEARS